MATRQVAAVLGRGRRTVVVVQVPAAEFGVDATTLVEPLDLGGPEF